METLAKALRDAQDAKQRKKAKALALAVLRATEDASATLEAYQSPAEVAETVLTDLASYFSRRESLK